MTARSGRLRLLGAAASLLARTAVLFLLLEIAARILGLHTGFFLVPAESNCLQRSGLLDMEFRPNCTGELQQTAIRTNAVGLRGAEVRDDGSRRILALGDSCTWGWRVPENESYPAVLAQLLAQRGGPVPHQVLNAGIPGHTSYQGLLYLRERGLSLHPAVVIIGYGFNDTATVGDVETRLAAARIFLPFMRLDDFLIQHSHLYRWGRWMTNPPRRTDLPARVPPEKYARNVSDMVTLAREHGAQVVLLNFVPGPNPYAAALKQIAERLDVPVIDYHGPKFDRVHPKPAGYRSLAAKVLATLEVRGYVE